MDGSTLYFGSRRPGGLGDYDLWVEQLRHQVLVDISRGGGPNPINLNSKRDIPVSILTTDAFDALNVDIESLLFGDPLLIDAGFTAVAPVGSSHKDVNHDGLADLSLLFSVSELVDNGVLGPLSMEGLLTGATLDGTPLSGRDTLRMVPPFERGMGNLLDGAAADLTGSALVLDNTITAVPEPSTFILAALGILSLLACLDRNRRGASVV